MKAHRTDGVSLTFAVLFLAFVASWITSRLVHVGLPTVGWFVAGALILFGLLGLLNALRSGRSGTGERDPGPTGSTSADSDVR
jgi:hypothetical protein